MTKSIDFVGVLEMINESNDALFKYNSMLSKYIKKNGDGFVFGRSNASYEERKIEAAYNKEDHLSYATYMMLSILNFEGDQWNRVYDAARYYKNWIKNTGNCIAPDSMICRLERYVLDGE